MILALDQSPALSAPARFFLTAPLYGAAAGALIALRSDAVRLSRWSPETLAAVHLLALGVLVQVAMGALLQLLPVAVGSTVPRTLFVARFCHVGLNAGAALLTAAFLGAGPALFALAAPVLLLTFTVYLGAIGVALWRAKALGPTLPALRIAALALAVTVALGVTLATTMGWALNLPLWTLVRLHAAWGVAGFGACLLAGVAYIVVPMFQLTQAYAPRFARGLPVALLLGLALWSLGVPLDVEGLARAGAAVLGVSVFAFAAYTARLLFRRKRRARDPMFRGWWLALACALGAAGAVFVPGPRFEYLGGVLVLAGAFPAFIAGMLYKIIPFLVWMHLSRRMPKPPMMNEVLKDAGPRRQLFVQAGAVALLLLGAWVPGLTAVGGVAFAAAQLLLLFNLAGGLRVYRAALSP